MRLATRLIRTPFGASNAQLASHMYGGNGWRTLKGQQDVLHRAAVAAAVVDVPGPLLGVTSGYREDDGRWGIDGRQAEWWSVVTYDGPVDDPCA